MIHGKHLRSHVERGLLCRRTVQEAGVSFQSISEERLEERRANTRVPCGPKGCLHDYVPFHFGPRSPMLYRINQRDLPAYTEGQRPLIYLVSSVAAMSRAALPLVFTNGHPVMALTDFFDDLARLSEVDHELMKAPMWANTEDDANRKWRRQAELLVHGHVPWALIEEIGVKDEALLARVNKLLQETGTPHLPAVRVRHEWYYPERS